MVKVPAVDGDWSMYLQRTVIGQCVPAVDGDWSLLAELLLGLVDLADEVDESLP